MDTKLVACVCAVVLSDEFGELFRFECGRGSRESVAQESVCALLSVLGIFVGVVVTAPARGSGFLGRAWLDVDCGLAHATVKEVLPVLGVIGIERLKVFDEVSGSGDGGGVVRGVLWKRAV